MNEKINILVVDDRPEGIMTVQAVLDLPEYNVVPAYSGNEALKHLLSMDFAVILLDVQMPVINGFETAAIIKTREKSKDIPIIFMSAINQDEVYVYQGYHAGAVDYLLKPFDPYILKSKVAVFVDIFKKNRLIKIQNEMLHKNEQNMHAMAITNLEIESLRRYQYLADSIPQIVFRVDANGRNQYFNKVWLEYTGLSNDFDIDWKAVIHPTDLENLVSLFEQNTNTDGSEVECRILNRNGFFRWHLIRIQPERYNDSKTVTSWLGTATDIQDRKQMEEANRFLANAGEILVSSLDQKTLLQNISNLAIPFLGDWCTYMNVTSDKKLQHVYTFHRDKKNSERAKKIFDLYYQNHENSYGIEKAIKNKEVVIVLNGEKGISHSFSIENELASLTDELADTNMIFIPIIIQNEVIGIYTFSSYESGKKYDKHTMAVCSELGKRLSLAVENSRLYTISQQAIETRNHFLSIASHELNTPITSLKLHLQMVEKSIKSNEMNMPNQAKFERSIEASVKQVNRLINLVQVLLDVSHIQSGKFKFVYEKVNVTEMVREIIERHKEILSNYNCQLELNLPENLDAIWDKTRIEQVFINLITNAIKYAPGKIDVTVREVGLNINILVKDYGQGIPENKLTSIFDRFERVSNNDNIGGLGLGLFIVKQIVEGHRGTIDIRSELGQGSCFSITIPKDATPLPTT